MNQWYTLNNTWNPNPLWDGPNYYRSLNIGQAGMVLAAHIAGIKSLWNHNAIFDYMDRVYAARTGAGGGDPVGETTIWAVATNGLSQLAYDMWGEFRAEYGSVWTPPV